MFLCYFYVLREKGIFKENMAEEAGLIAYLKLIIFIEYFTGKEVCLQMFKENIILTLLHFMIIEKTELLIFAGCVLEYAL